MPFVNRRHEFHVGMSRLIRSWSEALCDPTNALDNLPNLRDLIIRDFCNYENFPLFFAGLRVAVEMTSDYTLTIREPRPDLPLGAGIHGGTSFVICDFSTAEGMLDELPAGARTYHCDDDGRLERLDAV